MLGAPAVFPSLAVTLSASLFAISGIHVDAAIFLQISPGSGGFVKLTVEGSGLVSATNDNFLLVGTTTDTFLPDRAPQRLTGTTPAAPDPTLLLGGIPALNNFYRDDDLSGNFTGLDSIIGFYFGEGTLDGLLDLSDLNGVYHLPESRFSDFVVGTYGGLVPGNQPTILQGLGEVSLQVIPEPSVAFLMGIGAVLAATRRNRPVRAGQQWQPVACRSASEARKWLPRCE